MARTNKQYLFICHRNEEEITIETKNAVNTEIEMSENSNEELEFKVIGRINLEGLTIDFPSDRIEWYDETYKTSKALIDDAVIKIIQKLINKL